jgi:prevent-host-death family protein
MVIAREWQLQEAKSKLSQLVREADMAPQTITLHGRPAAVVMRYDEYRKLTSPQRSLVEVLRTAPIGLTDVLVERDQDVTLRELSL